MKRILWLFVSSFFLSRASFAQSLPRAPQTTFDTAVDLVQKGHFDLAVPVLEREVLAPDRTDAQHGRAWSLLAYSYKEEGKFELSSKAFNRALRLMEDSGNRGDDYAATLDFYAGLLMNTNDFDTAAKALHEARAVYIRVANHGGLVNIYTHTAELEIARKKYKPAEMALASARAEARQTSTPDDGMAAEMDGTAGWLAMSRGKYHDGVAAYSASLEEIRRQLGENNAVTAWSHLLLGKAQDLDHNFVDAARNFNEGLTILKQTVGTNNIRYLAGELAYSALLDDQGSHAQAQQLHSAADQSIRSLTTQQCVSCMVGVWSLRHQ